MARRRKYDTQLLLDLVDDFIIRKTNFKTIKFKDLVEFGKRDSELNDLNYQDFSRNPKVKERIDSYNEDIEFKLLNVNEHVNISQEYYLDATVLGITKASGLRKVREINERLATIYDDDRKMAKRIQEVKKRLVSVEEEKDQLQGDNDKKNSEIAKLKKQLSEARTDLNRKNRAIEKMRDYIEKNIYDPVVQQHLMEIGFLHNDSFDSNIHSEFPTSLEEVVEAEVLSSAEAEVLTKLTSL